MGHSQQACLAIDLTIAAGTDDERYIAWPYPGTWRLDKCKLAPATAVSLDGTDNFVVTLSANTSGAAFSALGTHDTDTGGTALVIGTTIDLDFDGAGDADRVIEEGAQIKIAKVEGGCGAALDGAYSFMATKIG